MAAYAALISSAQTLDQILNHGYFPTTQQEIQHILSVKKCVNFLRRFLDDFPEKAHSLEGRIRDVANEAEDMIESCMWNHLMCDHYGSRVRLLPHHFPDFEILTKKIESIAYQVMKLESSFTVEDEQQHRGSTSSATSSSTVAATVMVGLDDDLLAIKARLCGESSNLQIIPIVGMGGIGKTTLARNAFEDPLILEYFHIRVWVTVSQDYCVQDILSSLLDSIEEFTQKKSGYRTDLVEEKLYKSLKGSRYLIVLDDVWCGKTWDDLKRVFPDDGNGSRIMLTTRLSVVASYPDPCSPLYEMQLMDADQSWDLLRYKMFASNNCPPELEIIGKKIASNCRGLPLAIVVIAGVLSMVSKTTTSWEAIAENVNSAVATKDGHLEKILSLSYSHLPHHLRPCFLYMGSFPEDYEILVSELVKLLVAEGFLRGKYGSKSLEEEAEECLEDLVKRSLIIVSKRKSNGSIKSCSVHDLVRDLCIRKAEEEKFLLHAEKKLPERMKDHLRLSVAHFEDDCLADHCDSIIRTIKCFHCEGVATESLGNYKLLRILFAVFTKFILVTDESIPFSVQASKLFFLRYLNLYQENRLPQDISNLQNLQTLTIHTWKTFGDYPSLNKVVLPSSIWMMPQLRHLISFFFSYFPSPLMENESLENLQTLSLVTNFACTESVLPRIPNLKKLGLFYYRDGNKVQYKLENLVCLHLLEKLKIKIYSDCPFRENLNPVYPTSLRKLTLSGRRLPWEGTTVIGSLPNLEVLKLRDFGCKGSTWETNEGEFRQLKFLLIDKSDLQHWITDSSHFPRLKSLLLRRCWCLKEIPDGIGEISTLELIEVDLGNKSLVESAKRIQEEQQGWGNDALQVRWVHA